MNVTLADVLSGAAAHAVPLTAECAGYLVLAAADQAALAPRRMLAAELELCADGSVRVTQSRACEEAESERDLRALLDELLLAASSVTPALLRAGRRASTGSLATFVREIETALIPVNRAAARRALARLQRETLRALSTQRFTREQRVEPARAGLSRAASPVPPSVEVALAAIASPAPTPVAPLRAPTQPPPPVRSAPASARPVPPTVPNDPVPPAPLQLARLAAEPVLLPSLTPPPVANPEAETRPEPVVLRASAGPPAPSATPAPSAASLASATPAPVEVKPKTPVFGTVVAVRGAPSANERDTIPAAPLELASLIELESLDELESLVDLTEQCPPVCETDEQSLANDADEILAFQSLEPGVDQDPIPTPLVLTERLALPIVPPVARKAIVPPALSEPAESSEPARDESTAAAGIAEATVVAEPAVAPEPRVVLEPREAIALVAALEAAAAYEPEPPHITEPEPSPIAELARLAYAESVEEPELIPEIDIELISEVDLAVLVADREELPSWAGSSAEPELLTPPPRHALPRGRQSDVEDLLGRLDQAPLAVDDLRQGLKHLAGLELTPSPHRVVPQE